jgi:tetratricopeptide (TPR) repeat protein
LDVYNVLGSRKAPDLADEIVTALNRSYCAWLIVNSVINTYITFGRYRDALQLPSLWSMEAQESGRKDTHDQMLLAHINLAEAEYNLGQFDAAAERLSRIESAANEFPITRMGVNNQWAWLHTLRGEITQAKRRLTLVDVAGCPSIFHAELHFTRAAVALLEGRHDEALQHARDGQSCALRASSKRNALFVIARVLAAQGRSDAADSHYAAAVSMPYSGQGGMELHIYADLLSEMGRPDRAAEVRDLARRRDPESNVYATMVRLQHCQC